MSGICFSRQTDLISIHFLIIWNCDNYLNAIVVPNISFDKRSAVKMLQCWKNHWYTIRLAFNGWFLCIILIFSFIFQAWIQSIKNHYYYDFQANHIWVNNKFTTFLKHSRFFKVPETELLIGILAIFCRTWNIFKSAIYLPFVKLNS